MSREIQNVLKTAFLPEFLNRIDETIIFHPLGPNELAQIVDIQLGRLERQLAEAGLTLRVTRRAHGAAGGRGLRPGLRGPAAQAGHPAAAGQPAGDRAAGAEGSAKATSSRSITADLNSRSTRSEAPRKSETFRAAVVDRLIRTFSASRWPVL